MRVLFIESLVNNPVRISIAPPMAFISLYSFVDSKLSDIDFFFHSFEIDYALKIKSPIDKVLQSIKPDIVLASSITCNFNDICNLLKISKDHNCQTILGGLFPTANADWVLTNFPFIDVIVRGEGEDSFLSLLRQINNRLPLSEVLGISFRYNDNVIHNFDRPLLAPENLPNWSYAKVPIQIYKKLDTRFYAFASRGCTYDCLYCTLSSHWQRRCRFFSFDRVIAEIGQLVDLFSPKKISFGDDTLGLNEKYFTELLKEMAKLKFPVKFGGKTRLDIIDLRYLELMRQAGFDEISLGIESNDPGQLAKLEKLSIYYSQADLKKLTKIATELGFRVNLNFILGAPGETLISLENKANFIVDLCSTPNIIPLLGFLTPHPGTNLHKNINDFNIDIIDQNLNHYNHLNPVCLPKSLGTNGVSELKKIYNLISKKTGSEKYNPLLEITNE